MKSIILAGVSRSGKTTLARKLNRETGHSLIFGDVFVSIFGGFFPQLGIDHDRPHNETADNLNAFLIPYMDHLTTYYNDPFILDIFHLTPEQAIKHKLHEKYHVVFFGYPDITLEEKMKNIRTHKTAHYDWTDECEDAELKKKLESYIGRSKAIQKSCADLGLEFIDTSHDFEKAMDTAKEKILSALK